MQRNNHILIVDDNKSIHEDIQSIIAETEEESAAQIAETEAELFGVNGQTDSDELINYNIKHAYQGEEAVLMVKESLDNVNPFSLIFMDIRMPPGMDGIETIQKIREDDPYVEIVICSAYSDYSWNQILKQLGQSDKLLFMKKPFDATALKQTALTLTTKWNLQQEANHYTETLEEQVEERTKELNNLLKEYKMLKEKAEEATRAKSEFLANMSHEIRTPLNGVVVMNDLLLDTEMSGEQKELAVLANHSAQALLHIINDILDFSKIEAGKLQIEDTSFNLHQILKETVDVLSITAVRKQLDLQYSCEDSVPGNLIGDPMRLKQVLLNYGNNSIKFTDEGNIKIDVNVQQNFETEIILRISVSDTGIGIPESKQKILFQPFTQADASTTRNYGGSGLGLVICKQLAELMNGEVGLESKEGKGSTFWFTARLKKQENEIQKEKGKGGKIDSGKETNQSEAKFSGMESYQILVAENNESNQFVVKKILDKIWCRYEFVDNGVDVIKKLEQDSFDLVFLDYQMPIMDGVETAKAIRELEKVSNDHIPVIALSASARQEDKKICLESGMDDFLAKPFRLDEFIEKVKKWARTDSGKKSLQQNYLS